MIEMVLRAVPTKMSLVSLQSGWKVTQQSTLTGEISAKEISICSSPSETASIPTYFAPQLRNAVQTDLGAYAPTTREKTLSLRWQWQPQSSEEDTLNIQCKIWSPQHQGGKQPAYTRKEVAGIHIKTTLAPKNIKLT